MPVGTDAPFHIAYPSDAVLLLEVYVHDQRIFLPSLLYAERQLLVTLPLVDLDVLHGVGRQVVERNLGVAPEEIVPVEHQAAYLLPVDKYLPLLVDARAGQHLYQLVQHGAFRKVERIGIVDERIAPEVHLDLRGPHHHLVQYGFLILPFHVDVA